MSPETERRRFVVIGRVQGVFFRESTRREAIRIGIKAGFVANQPDGTVLCEAEGSPETLDQLKAYLQRGPELARVQDLREVPVSAGRLPSPFAVSSPGGIKT